MVTWTMRQYAGSGAATEANARCKHLLSDGAAGLSVAFDLPTRMGHDSDAPIARGEVGRAGVAIDSIDDMRVLFAGIPLDKVSTSMTVDAPASLLLLLYQLVGEEQGVAADRLTGTVQNDVLKEYIARGTPIFPPKPSLRLLADTFAYCETEIPQWNTLSVCGHTMAQVGASPAQEIAFALADGIEYVRTAVAAGIDVDAFAPRLSFCLGARTTVLEEVATSRAARRIWAKVMREEFGARNPASLMPRFRTRTAGTRPAARRPEAVVVRRPHAVLGATPSPHTGSPAGSYAVEAMTDAVEAATVALMRRVEELGGAAAAIEVGFQRREIEGAVPRVARTTGSGGGVGAGPLPLGGAEPRASFRAGPSVEARQGERLAKLRAWRDQDRVDRHLAGVRKAAAGDDSVLYPMKDALSAGATVGEVCDALREIWGTCTPGTLV
ncbi:methylmalonyl-CoA mutase, N-terminal domain [Streptomyces sp. BpilaLS-43]|nr:methylmalonyl-CoA mutase, N-terminal domain [Streptomyces sp. BpilaLS-43]